MQIFACVLYLAEEVSFLLSLGEAGQVAADHQVRIIQHCIKPTPGGKQSLYEEDTMVIWMEKNAYTYTLTLELSQLYVIHAFG